MIAVDSSLIALNYIRAHSSPDLHRRKYRPKQQPQLSGTVLSIGSLQKLVMSSHCKETPDFCLAGKQLLQLCIVYMFFPRCCVSWRNGEKRGQKENWTKKRLPVPETHVGAKLADAAGPVALRAGEKSNMGATGHKDVTS